MTSFFIFMTISLLMIGCLRTCVIYFICLFTTYFISILYIVSEGVSMFNSLIHVLSSTVSDPGEIEWSKNVIFLCLIFYIKPKTCSFSCNEACPLSPPPILSQVNLNLALLDLYSIPSDFCIHFRVIFCVWTLWGVFIFMPCIQFYLF